MALEIQHITKRFGRIKALDDVSIAIENGALVCFLGPSGCGKTTLLRVIAGLEWPDRGELRLAGRDLSSVPARKRNFGVVFQSYSLFPNMTIAANIAYGLECRQWRKQDMVQRVEEMLDMVHLKDQADKFSHQLSGGQQQRVALARALAPQPEMLLLDEPLSALDAKVREELRGEIRLLQQRLGITTIMVTHDQEEALTMADIIVVMQNGRVMQSGSPMTLYQQPENRFVAEFLGRMNVVPAGLGVPVFNDKHLTGVQPRILGIRPEDISLGSSHDKNDRLAGVIDQVIRLGNLTRVTVRLHAYGIDCGPGEKWCNGETLRIVAEMQGVHEDLQVGMPRSITILPQSVRVLE